MKRIRSSFSSLVIIGGLVAVLSPLHAQTTTIATNGLWLEITNVSDGLAYLNLNNATDSVYAIWSTTNLPARAFSI